MYINQTRHIYIYIYTYVSAYVCIVEDDREVAMINIDAKCRAPKLAEFPTIRCRSPKAQVDMGRFVSPDHVALTALCAGNATWQSPPRNVNGALRR